MALGLKKIWLEVCQQAADVEVADDSFQAVIRLANTLTPTRKHELLKIYNETMLRREIKKV